MVVAGFADDPSGVDAVFVNGAPVACAPIRSGVSFVTEIPLAQRRTPIAVEATDFKGNRSAAIRIPKYANQPETARFEFRPPDATCNVYLALAAQLLVGLDGIRNKIDPTKAGFGPFEANIFSWTNEQRAKIKKLPGSLNEALIALEEDHDFLTVDEVFTEEMIQQWVDYKRHYEYFPVRNRPHPFEMSLYFDV